MRYPKIKNPTLCRLVSYVVVLGIGLLPIILIIMVPVSDIVSVLVMIASLLGLLVYLVRNFSELMMMDLMLAMFACMKTARKQYELPKNRTERRILHSVSKYGKDCTPTLLNPRPAMLRYKYSSSATIYARGIERVVAVYQVDELDKATYQKIFTSAKTNSQLLTGKTKTLILDKQQKKAPLHRVTVVIILAQKLESSLMDGLYDLLLERCGDEEKDCILPCVVDLKRRVCAFNCLRVPYVGFGYAVKNRGIRIIRNMVFGGSLPLAGNTHYVSAVTVENEEESLWSFWKRIHYMAGGAERELNRIFASMAHGEIRIVDEGLCLKWGDCGIYQQVEMDKELQKVYVESISNWTYPNNQLIGKKKISEMEKSIVKYYAGYGFSVEFGLK